MYLVVNGNGTGRAVRNAYVDIAGKTGITRTRMVMTTHGS
jgi:cell division protein FtsI/penicillin-binding protein 2